MKQLQYQTQKGESLTFDKTMLARLPNGENPVYANGSVDTASGLSGTLLSNAGDGGMKIDGKSVQQGVIQLVNTDTQSVTLVSGNKYITKISDVWSIVTGAGSAVAVTGGTDMVVDLTAMGMNISTVQQFRDVYPDAYYEYSTTGNPTPTQPVPIWSVSPRDVLHPVQLVQNGNFADGTSGWYAYSTPKGTLSAESNVLTYTYVVQSTDSRYLFGTRRTGDTTSYLSGHKMLLLFDVMLSFNSTGFGIDQSSSTGWMGGNITGALTANTWAKSELLFTPSANGTLNGIIFRPDENNIAVGESYSLRNVMLIDLTAIYGAGNEPTTVEQFRADYPAEYYPYLATANNSRAVYDTNKNLFDGEKFANYMHDVYGCPIDTTAKTVDLGGPIVRGKKYYFDFVPKPNTSYTFYGYINDRSGSNVLLYYTDGTYTATCVGIWQIIVTTNSNKTLSHIGFVYYVTNCPMDYTKFGILEGVHTVEEFESYQGVTIPIPELHGIGDVKDTFEPRVWYDGAWRSRLTRRIGVINSYNGESIGDTWISTTGQLSTGANVIYPLASPVITYGDPVQIQQFAGQTNAFSDSIIQPTLTATAVKHS